MRKIVQISTISPAVAVSNSLLKDYKIRTSSALLALCDDGSIWGMTLKPASDEESSYTTWDRCPDIPQD